MGADIVGFIGCPLQNSLGLDGFLAKLKLRTYKVQIEERVPAHQRSQLKVEVAGSNRATQMLTYDGIVREVSDFEQGIPECANCPISGGRPIGCYRYIKYPIDSLFEKTVFEFFVSQLPIRDSICAQIYQDITSNVPLDSPWHTERGFSEEGVVAGALAMLPKPFVHEWQEGNLRKRVDSAQVLSSLFISLDRPALTVAYVSFWQQFIEFARDRVTNSPTFDELLRVFPMYMQILPLGLQSRGLIYIEA